MSYRRSKWLALLACFALVAACGGDDSEPVAPTAADDRGDRDND